MSHPVSAPSLPVIARLRRAGLVASLAALAVPLALGEDKVPPVAEAKPTMVPVEMFAAPDGLEVTVWAASPLFSNPTNIDIDRDGDIWVAEGVNYRGKFGRRKEGDRIMVLSDSDGDGKADKSHVFVQEEFLVAPLGVSVIDNKIIVAMTPDMIVYTDVNRNKVFDAGTDTREVLLTGFNGRNHDHSLHSTTVGPDGLWYFNHGNCGAVFTDKSGKTFRIGSPYNPQPMPGGGPAPFKASDVGGEKSDDGHVYLGGATVRMNPDGTNAEVIGHNYRNSYEQTVTSVGDLFQNDNDDPPACRVANILEYGNAGFASRDGKRSWQADRRPGQSTPVAEWRQDDPGTMPAGDVYGGGSPTGIVYYENGALGANWTGLLLSCEPGRNVVFGYLPKPAGAGFRLDRTDWLTTNVERKFTGSDFTGGKWDGQLNTQFRPADVAVGADGAIYVADWFDGRVGGHQTLDDGITGTIYRIAPKGFKPSNPKFDEKTTEGLIAALKSPAVNVRAIGFSGLKAQGDKAVPAVAALLGDANPYIAARATWLLAQMGPAGVAKVAPLLQDKDEAKRLVAYRALRRARIEVLKMAAAMAGDASAGVRREVALTLRDVPAADSVAILAQLAKGFDGKDRAYLDALGIGSTAKEKEVYAAVVKDAGAPEAWSETMAWIAWRLGSVEAVPALKARALSGKIGAQQKKLAMDGLAFIQDRSAAQAMIELAGTTGFPHKAMATWWCMNRMNNEWKDFGVREALKAAGVYDPDKVVIQPIAAPPAPAEPSKLSAEEALKLTGNAAAGQARIAVCYTCHHIGSQGMEFGPDLTMFGKTQPRDVVIDAIINPSKDISHGFDGSTVVTTDGNIDGIVLANGDPVIVKSMGGIVQTIPKAKVKEIKKLGRSLMFTADMMGLDHQGLADIAAYLASDIK
jgi:putative membrane-bound dehydrogenase-like protein